MTFDEYYQQTKSLIEDDDYYKKLEEKKKEFKGSPQIQEIIKEGSAIIAAIRQARLTNEPNHLDTETTLARRPTFIEAQLSQTSDTLYEAQKEIILLRSKLMLAEEENARLHKEVNSLNRRNERTIKHLVSFKLQINLLKEENAEHLATIADLQNKLGCAGNESHYCAIYEKINGKWEITDYEPTNNPNIKFRLRGDINE